MSAKQYNDYLVQCFLDEVNKDIQAGFRYQFKSPNTENSLALYDAFLRRADKQYIEINNVKLPFLICSSVQIIPVLHNSDGKGFTENYISYLRDEVAGRSGVFEHSALFIIHNSMLDTLINSALDIGACGSVWSPETIAKVLREQIHQSGSDKRSLYECLLEDQLELIIEEGATVFGFSPLFSAIIEDSLKLNTFGLFNDPILLNMVGQTEQVRRRLDENRNLYNRIEHDVEHYADQLEKTLDDFSPRFIKEHFEDQSNWQSLEFNEYLDEINANKVQKLLFESAEIADAILYERAKSQTKAGLKERSLLFQIPQNQQSIDLVLTFLGNDLKAEQVQIKSPSIKAIPEVNRAGGKRCRVKIQVPFTGEPTFISIDIKRENRSEECKFKCLLVEKDRFYLEEIKNCFRIDSAKAWMTLLIEGNQLRIKADGDDIYAITENAINDVSLEDYSIVDFEDLANQTDTVQFNVCSGQQTLLLNIEGPAAEDSVNTPLLFDQDRFHKLLTDDYNAEYNRSKNKIIIDNSESLVVGIRQSLLAFESDMVSKRLLYLNDSEQLSIDDLQSISPTLYQTYDTLFKYLDQYKTLPSLVAWGSGFCGIVQSVLDAYEEYLLSIPLNDVLKNEHKQILKIGIHKQADRERISPIHPLVLAYYLQLVREINNDRDADGNSSFTKLPSVTLDRLVPSGLLPFVYHKESNFAHVVPVKENTFWLEIVPQKQVSYNYVKRLVRDKLDEFTRAYSRLFSVGSRSTLIINFINQGVAAELFLGLMEYFKERKEKAFSIHVNFYDDVLIRNEFDRFSETSSYDELKDWLTINSGAFRGEADLLIDIIRSRLTYSKFTIPKENEQLAYAHLAFFKNNLPVDCRLINTHEALSGVLCGGLIAGEASEIKGGAYFTSFGLRQVETHHSQALRLAALLGNLWQPSQQANTPYLGNGIGLAVSTDFEGLLERSYDSALWTTIIDPKVTLDFFTTQKDVVLIHYSDQYTTSAGYDAITVTKQVDLFKRLLYKESGGSAINNLLSEFNAFNGEWLLRMLTAPPKDRKEKNGIIGGYKFVSALLCQSDISWIPLSVAEIIRVSGNVGLKMNDSEFSRSVHGYRKGAISDDVLFVGFKDDTLYLLPLEVKTGVRPDYAYAGQQAKELKRYLIEEVLQPKTLASRLYRGLFIRQVLMQVEKFQLYQMISYQKLDALLLRREWWLDGEYHVSSVPDYVDGFVLAHVENDTCFEPSYKLSNDNILQIELPYSLLPSLISLNITDDNALVELVKTYKINSEYVLKANTVANASEAISATISTALDEAEVKPVTVVVSVEEKKPLQILFGHDSFTKVPLYWEPTNTAKFMNTNTGIIGTMGTGKTQFTKSVITQLMRNQHCNVNGEPIGILIFDYKSDYVDDAFIAATGAKKFKLFKLPYNPLSLYGDTPMLPVHTAAGFAETMTRAYGLGKKQQLKLENLILECYEAAGIYAEDSSTWGLVAPTIEDVWQRFLSAEKIDEDSLYAALSKLARFKIFETIPEKMLSLYDLMSGVTVIELAGYPSEVQNLIVALTLDLFYSQMQKKGKPKVQGDYRQITKMILVDEADNFMSQDFPSLRKILKEGREYGVGVILSTQDITHFKTGDNNYASYVLTWVIHRVSEIKNADIKAIFNKDDRSEQEQLMETIRKLDKHYSLYIDGDKQMKKMRDRAFWEI